MCRVVRTDVVQLLDLVVRQDEVHGRLCRSTPRDPPKDHSSDACVYMCVFQPIFYHRQQPKYVTHTHLDVAEQAVGVKNGRLPLPLVDLARAVAFSNQLETMRVSLRRRVHNG